MKAFLQQLRTPSVLPGFGLTLSITVFYLSLIVLIPLSGLVIKSTELSFAQFIIAITEERVIAAFRVSFVTAFSAAVISAILGLIIAWVLVRYHFFGKKALDALVDIPFALPTAVAGIALSAIYSPNGWIGQFFEPLGIHISFTPIGITIALVFIGLPFVVRTVEPILQDMERETEEAALCLGANRTQTFTKVILPHITPALLTGFAMAFARALGEYGSVIFIAGNMPYISEIVPLLVIIKLEQYDVAGATSIALTMLTAAFLMLFVINFLQHWGRKRQA